MGNRSLTDKPSPVTSANFRGVFGEQTNIIEGISALDVSGVNIYRRKGMAELSNRDERWHWAALGVAVVLLDASLAFGNLWPTPAIRWTGALSVEFAFCVLAMALAHHWFG